MLGHPNRGHAPCAASLHLSSALCAASLHISPPKFYSRLFPPVAPFTPLVRPPRRHRTQTTLRFHCSSVLFPLRLCPDTPPPATHIRQTAGGEGWCDEYTRWGGRALHPRRRRQVENAFARAQKRPPIVCRPFSTHRCESANRTGAAAARQKQAHRCTSRPPLALRGSHLQTRKRRLRLVQRQHEGGASVRTRWLVPRRCRERRQRTGERTREGCMWPAPAARQLPPDAI